MSIERWNPGAAVTTQEKHILARCRKKRKLFAVLREHRAELFNDELQNAPLQRLETLKDRA